jgi:hypothetical protein
MESLTTAIIPRDDRVIFVSLFNCAEFSSRLSEVAQALHAISGIKVLVGGRWLGERWLLGTIVPTQIKNAPALKPGHLVPNIAYRKTKDLARSGSCAKKLTH